MCSLSCYEWVIIPHYMGQNKMRWIILFYLYNVTLFHWISDHNHCNLCNMMYIPFNMIEFIPIVWLLFQLIYLTRPASSTVWSACIHLITSHTHFTYAGIYTLWSVSKHDVNKQSAFRRTVKLLYTLPLFVHFIHSLALVGIPLYPSSSVGLHLIKRMHSLNMHILCDNVIWKNCRNIFL